MAYCAEHRPASVVGDGSSILCSDCNFLVHQCADSYSQMRVAWTSWLIATDEITEFSDMCAAVMLLRKTIRGHGCLRRIGDEMRSRCAEQ
eukprot:COSAG02_NODE_131_length_34710_cov_17.171159_28_plen_90_part_00